MALAINTRYDATVSDAALIESQEKKTPALWFRLDTSEGTIEHQEYITVNTVARLRENMHKCFRVTPAQLSDMEWLNALGTHLKGKPCSIVTEGEEMKNGDIKVVVQWMNPPRITQASDDTKAKASKLFGGTAMNADGTDPWLTDAEAAKW